MKVKTCKSLSGRSTLGYVIEGNTLRIVSNSGGGSFSPDPVSLAQLEGLMDANAGHLKTKHLAQLFAGKSVNTAGFVLAALRDQGEAND